ncbi:hypothetical protein [Microcystis aeruginosa]|uniref:hypothetical protein n=1 Tax=Microcystis aeruginosa TaxID=1126 RepID=UPI00187C2570|nr:hypothetical protein [Microcystis aeruginosa]
MNEFGELTRTIKANFLSLILTRFPLKHPDRLQRSNADRSLPDHPQPATISRCSPIPESDEKNVGWFEALNPTPAWVTLPLTHPTNNCASLLIPHRIRSRI